VAKKKSEKAEGPQRRVIARNKRARHAYHLEVTVEAGLVLKGSEVKSLREGHMTIDQAYARIANGEAWLVDADIPSYLNASWNDHLPKRPRKLLLHRSEIRKLEARLRQAGRTLVPLEVYFNERGIAKILIAVGIGRRTHDKRQNLARKDAEREMQRVSRNRR
jgi:SsrA-binding protein